MSQFMNSQYDSGAGAFGGKPGGFQASQSPMATPATGQKQRQERSLVPATIRMLKESDVEGDTRIVNGRPLTSVKVVGRIQEVETKAAYTNILVDDSTGTIAVKQWIDDGKEGAAPQYMENDYVSVWGKVSVFQGTTQLNAYSIRKVKSFNEISHHLISVAHAYLTNKKAAASGGSTFAGGATTTGLTTTGMAGSGGGAADDKEDWTECQRAVFNAIKNLSTGQSENGVHVPSLTSHVSYSAPEIRDAVAFLQNEGAVYDTVSEEWVRSTEEA